MSPPHDPSESAGKRRRLVLRKMEPQGGARPSGQPPMPTTPPPMRPRLPSVSVRPGSGLAEDLPSSYLPSEALPPSEGVPTVRRPLTGVSAITASAAEAAHTPAPAISPRPRSGEAGDVPSPPSEVHRISRNQTRSSLPPVVAGSERSAPYSPPKQSSSFRPGSGEAGDLPSASTRAALIGAALGLAIVAGLVVVARTRVPSKSASGTAIAVETQGALKRDGTSAAGGVVKREDGMSAAGGVVKLGDVPSGRTADNSPIVATTSQHPRTDVAPPAALALHAGPATLPPKAHTPLYRAPLAPKSVGVAGEPAAAPAPIIGKASSNDEAPQDDGASSLVPVIPQSAPPPADPLIQAVQHDIEEEEHAKAK